MTVELFDLLTEICTKLVDTPVRVTIEIDDNEEGVHYIVRTERGEEGQLIGKAGSLINSIRTIMRSSARKLGDRKVYVDIATGTKGLS